MTGHRRPAGNLVTNDGDPTPEQCTGTAACGRPFLQEWLRVEFGLEEIGNALGAPDASFDRFAAGVTKRGPGRAGLTATAVKRLQYEVRRTSGQLGAIGMARRA
jgi:hypothetical protein